MNVLSILKGELPDFKFRFEKQTEAEFRRDYINKSVGVIRAGYLLCIFLYAIFGLLDIWIVPETKHLAWFIRFAIVIPVVILTIISSFFNFFKRHNQILLIISSVIVGLGIVGMISFSKPTELGYKYYYSGLMLVMIWIYTYIRLRFWSSLISGLTITLGYELVAIFVQHLTDGAISEEGRLVFINNNFFFLSANILGLFASYHNEKLHRTDFLQKQTIKDENLRILNFSQILSQKNEEITAQTVEIKKQRDRVEQQNCLLEAQQEAMLWQNKELHEVNATKDKFFSIISHDLKNPFNSILLLSEALVIDIQSMDSARIKKNAASINKSARNAYKLLENLLEWSRSQTGLIEFKQVWTPIQQLFDTANDVSESIANQKNISLRFELDESTEVFIDREMMNTTLRNLISNAIKYSEKGGVIVVRAQKLDEKIVISVIDNGVGVDSKRLEKLFQLSGTISTPGTEKEQGTGLGLHLCKEFIENHGGTIWVESTEGKGSCFKFSIPLSAEQNQGMG